MGAVTSTVIAGAAVYSAYQADEAAKDAKRDARKQEAKIALQEKKIEKKLKEEEAVKVERKERLAKNELLSGTAAGTSLLGVKNV